MQKPTHVTVYREDNNWFADLHWPENQPRWIKWQGPWRSKANCLLAVRAVTNAPIK